MKILFIGHNVKNKYSGGRYHAWIMAQACIAAGYDVDYWSDNLPYFTFDFENKNYQNQINMDLSLNYKLFKSKNYDYIVLVPGGMSNMLYYKALATSFISKSKLILLNFESPNWYNSLASVKKDEKLWCGWELIAKYSSIILSSAKESSKYAEKYYEVDEYTEFISLSPSVNSFRINDNLTQKEDEIIVITRFDKNSLHKGGLDILKIFTPEISKYKIKFLIGMGIDSEIKNTIEEKAVQNNISVEFLYSLDDRKKHLEIKKSKFMIFLSKFEGFGYPPVEALYNGTRCITYPLPVFKETCGDCIDYVNYNDYEAIIKILKNEYFPLNRTCEENIKNLYSFETYVNNIKDIFDSMRVYKFKNNLHYFVYYLSISVFYNSFFYAKKLLVRLLPTNIKVIIKKYVK